MSTRIRWSDIERQDIVGTLELMVVYVESGTCSSNAYGHTRESLYSSLAAGLLAEHPDFYPLFQHRLRALLRQSADIGWGYSEAVNEIVGQMDADMEAEMEEAEADDHSSLSPPAVES
ncbi:MAG: hypothetical protein HY782_00955 [Chloroflexi bacterium]|nr:hypothetical protein [Chloroflexota bacterium]